MKRFYLILSICLFGFFLIPKISDAYVGITYVAMAIATIVGELIIPVIIWYILFLLAMRNESLKKDPYLSYKLLFIVALFSAFTSVGLLFPEFASLFDR